ncbi:MAG: GIY-YIG nuclease family protein [Patescibacteria group bacterium]
MSIGEGCPEFIEGQMKYYVYILKCDEENLYTGSTCDLKNRIEKHKKGEGAIFTRNRKSIKLVYKELYKIRELAEKREKQIKGWCRKKKINLIKFGHPLG